VDYEREPTVGWAPKSWKYSFYAGGKLRKSLAAEVKRFAVNVELNDEDFAVAFPPGSIVVDKVEGRTWLVRDDGEKRFILDSERGATYDEIKNSQSGQARGARSR
jgi:hypothetical protein